MLDGLGDQCHAPATLPPGKNWCPLHRRLGRPQGLSRQVMKISHPLGFDSDVVRMIWKKKYLFFSGIRTPDRKTPNPVTASTGITRLRKVKTKCLCYNFRVVVCNWCENTEYILQADHTSHFVANYNGSEVANRRI